MLLHSALADILLKFQAQLCELTLNAIAQLSKYFWVVSSFRGMSSGDVFAMQYELHYQSKRMEIDEGSLFTQYGCLNFLAKANGGPKLSLTIKNKWSSGVDKCVILLSGSLPLKLRGWKKCVHSAVSNECARLHNGARGGLSGPRYQCCCLHSSGNHD
jgi:hypothetical protein